LFRIDFLPWFSLTIVFQLKWCSILPNLWQGISWPTEINHHCYCHPHIHTLPHHMHKTIKVSILSPLHCQFNSKPHLTINSSAIIFKYQSWLLIIWFDQWMNLFIQYNFQSRFLIIWFNQWMNLFIQL
jgi:hypothetical protein